MLIKVENVKPMQSEAELRAALKKRKKEAEYTDEGVLEVFSRSELTMEEGIFNPLYLVSEWTEPLTTRARVAVAILLLSGVRKDAFGKHMYRLEVIDGESILQLRDAWPAEMTNVCILHTLWLVVQKEIKVSEHHPKLGGFESLLWRLRSERTNNVFSI